MSVSSNSSNDRMASNRSSYIESDNELPERRSSLPNIQPELTKIVRKLLPHELSLNIHVRNVDYFESGCERLNGTLYMTIFRLIFAPDNEIENNNIITSGNRYIGEYDIPLTSIFKLNIASQMDAKSSLLSFRNDSTQIQNETKSFTILTRDFRNITFSKTIFKQPNLSSNKIGLSLTKMETYINALIVHSRFQHKAQLYPHIATQKLSLNSPSPKSDDDYGFFSTNTFTFDDDLADFSTSNDERIKSYLMSQHWQDELNEANEIRWEINRNKFDSNNIVKEEGPFIHLKVAETAECQDLIWHWTHTYDLDFHPNPSRYMLVTIIGIADVPNPSESNRRRSTLESTLQCSGHYAYDEFFQRFNLANFPCTLKQLESNFGRLIELCTTPAEEDDNEKWLMKFNTCKWLRYVSKALRGAASIAKSLNFKNVQLAGSDIDNSCLMSSLIQILLRPQCRTIKGFCELIVREWIIPGHPFRERFGQIISDNDKSPAQESPVFLLFLDCVYQLLHQNPSLFQFTEYFLIEIYHNVCYCYQHTFAFNTISERLNAMETCPKNILILSAFDFSLYMSTDICHLIKNHASVFMPKKKQPPPTLPRTRRAPTTTTSNKMSQIHNLLEQSLNFNSPRLPIRAGPNKLLRPTIELPTPPPPPPPPMSDLLLIKPEQFKYEHIEAPQKFASDLYVDWRIFNLVLWSKCYCRYDQSYLPPAFEQEISAELSSFEQRLNKTPSTSREQTTTDALNSFQYANSWHPEIIVTRV